MEIIKRNGDRVQFKKEKIVNAIYKAMEYGSGIVKMSVAENIADEIENVYIKTKKTPSVYDVERMVFLKLIEKGEELTAQAYEGYRAIQEYRRENHPLDNSLMGLLKNTNIEVLSENTNKKSTLVSTQRDLLAGEVSKYISKTKLIPSHIIQAHEKGIIKIHDLDYYAQAETNCELVPLDDMFKNGTVINGMMIETPKSLRTASTLATQIAQQISSMTYGGQTMSLSHLAPYVRASEDKIKQSLREELVQLGLSKVNKEKFDSIVNERLKKEIKDSVQTFNYQINTMNSTNGQSPFISLAMYLDENPEYKRETAMLIEEFLKQRIAGIKNKNGVMQTQIFPKLLFFLDEDNMYPTSEYYYLKELAIKCTSLRMNPDYISVKKMKEVYGYAYPCIKICA